MSEIALAAVHCQDACAALGTVMLCVRSDEEGQLLASADGVWKEHGNTFGEFWIGYNDKESEG